GRGKKLVLRVAGQALASDFLPEIEQLLFGQPAFEVGARIDARRHMALDVEAVAAVVFALGMPEMVEAGAKQAGQRGKRADMAAEVAAVGRVQPVGVDHHGHGVPAHVGAQALLDFKIARGTLFLVGFYGVDISGVGRKSTVYGFLYVIVGAVVVWGMGT